MSSRSFEGYSYEDSLGAGFYGHAYRARGPSGESARLLEVGSEFSAHQEFAAMLLARGKLLTSFEHPHVVRTRAVGRAPDGHLLVVTDPVEEPSSLEQVLGGVTDADMHPLPRPVATAVVAAVVEALAVAHQRSVVHGALHPRSVLIDRQGTVKLDDLAVGRALTSWSGRDSATAFVHAFAGFLAPEMSQGGRPDAATDVYAAGALLLATVTGRTAASSFDPSALSPAVAGVVARALDTNRLHRYANARRLLDDLSAAWKADGWERAARDEISAHLEQQQGSAEAALERETATVLSFLGDVLTPPPPAPELDAAMEAMLAEIGDEAPAPGPEVSEDASEEAARASAPTMQMPAALAAAERSPARAGGPDTRAQDDRAATEISAPDIRGQDDRAATEIAPARASSPAGPGDTAAPAGPDASSSAAAEAAPAPARPPARASSEAAALAALADLDPPDDDATARVETVAEPAGPAAGFGASIGQPDDATLPVETMPRPERAVSEITDVLAIEDVEVLEDAEAGDAEDGGGMSAAAQAATPASAATPARPVVDVPAPGAPGGPDPLALIHDRPTELMPSQRDRAAALATLTTPRARPAGPQIPDLGAPGPRRRPMVTALWILAVAAAVVMLILVLRHQGVLRDQAEQRADEREAEQREQLRAYMADQPESGRITIDSEPPEAAVWLLLGRTPLDTTKLSASMVHELRLELDGHRPQDLRVTGEHWTGEGEELRAEISGRLEPGTVDAPPPAYPPEPPPEALQGLPDGHGVIHVTSQPAGAQVWLLVGITPEVDVTAVAGAGYELKVRKDGHLPGVVVVRPQDWEAGGQQITRSITLQRSERTRRR